MRSRHQAGQSPDARHFLLQAGRERLTCVLHNLRTETACPGLPSPARAPTLAPSGLALGICLNNSRPALAATHTHPVQHIHPTGSSRFIASHFTPGLPWKGTNPPEGRSCDALATRDNGPQAPLTAAQSVVCMMDIEVISNRLFPTHHARLEYYRLSSLSSFYPLLLVETTPYSPSIQQSRTNPPSARPSRTPRSPPSKLFPHKSPLPRFVTARAATKPPFSTPWPPLAV